MPSFYKNFPQFNSSSVKNTPRLLQRSITVQKRILNQDLTNQGPKQYFRNNVRMPERPAPKQRYTSGISIPHTIIKSNLKVPKVKVDDKNLIRKERDEYVKKLLNRFQPTKNQRCSCPVSLNKDNNRSVLTKITSDLQKISMLRKPKKQSMQEKSSIGAVCNWKPIKTKAKSELWTRLKGDEKTVKMLNNLKSARPEKAARKKLQIINKKNVSNEKAEFGFIKKAVNKYTNNKPKTVKTATRALNQDTGNNQSIKCNASKKTENMRTPKKQTNENERKPVIQKNTKLSLKSANFLITNLKPVTTPTTPKTDRSSSPMRPAIADKQSQTGFSKLSKLNTRMVEKLDI